MNDRLIELMTESAERVDVGPPPLAAIRRSAGRRRAAGLAVAAAAVVAVAASGAGVLPGLAGSDPGPASTAPGGSEPEQDRGVPVLLDQSPFEVGVDTPRGQDVLRGELRSTQDQRCLVVGDGENPVHWPHDWSGRTFDDGGLVLYDQDGAVVAEVGEQLVLGGVLSDPAEWSGDQVCDPGVVRVFMVETVLVE